MRDFVILTDSCCSFSDEEVKELGIKVLPLSYTVNGKTYRDLPSHEEMSLSEFYSKIREGADCTTSAVNQGQYLDAMKSILDEGKDVLCICFSGSLSCTYQSAYIAAAELREQYPGAKIEVVDSRSACGGQGMLVYKTVMESKRKKMSLEETVQYCENERNFQNHWFIVDDLNHLKKGGRISTLTAVAGGLLGIKPVLICDNEGKLVSAGKARGYKAAMALLVDKMEEYGFDPDKDGTVFIRHTDCIDYVNELSDMIRERFGVKDIRVNYNCPVIGCHTGCGCVALFYTGNKR